jgi:monomeric sarcosine oxidase
VKRREFVRAAGAGAVGAAWLGRARAAARTATGAAAGKTYDVAIVGAGCFGAWTAYHLRNAGKSVVILDKYGAANARASSGGESRVIRAGYGKDELYTRFAQRSLGIWKSVFERVRQPSLYRETGVLWMAAEGDPIATATVATLARLGIKHERLDRAALAARYPQIAPGPNTWAIFEPEAGVLLARRAVQAVVQETVRLGADYRTEEIAVPSAKGRLASIATASTETISAGTFVFACGPWLPKVLPGVLGDRIFPTRQEVLFFGVPPGDKRFEPPAMPVWIDVGAEIYGLPDIESRGFKAALDRHGPPIDPDTAERLVPPESVAKMREFLTARFPALKDAPLVESRVCQYENTSNGDFLIDRHPELENVWMAGGGSGHGFKHGPAVGEYLADRILNGGPVDPRFSLATKATVQNRSVH